MIEIDLDKISKNELATILIEKDKEIERLNNIINKLEEEISKHIALCTDITLNDVLDILQELKHKKIYGSVDSEILYYDELGSEKE